VNNKTKRSVTASSARVEAHSVLCYNGITKFSEEEMKMDEPPARSNSVCFELVVGTTVLLRLRQLAIKALGRFPAIRKLPSFYPLC